jgi:hypothetical protein
MPSEITPRMLAALTGLPSPFCRVTGAPAAAAAFVKSFAGRACSPCVDPISTVRTAIFYACLSSCGDGHPGLSRGPGSLRAAGSAGT